MCAGPDVEVTRGGAAAARRSAVPAVPGGASPNPNDSRFSPAPDDARNRAAAAAAAARAPALPLVPIPSVARSPNARIAPLGSDPPRSPDAARAPPARNLDHTAARSRTDPNHDRNRTARDPNRAAARRVVASDECSPVSRVFVHADRRPHDRVDARLENVPRACSPAAKRPRSSLGSADDAGLAASPSPPFDSVDPPDDDDDDDDTPSRKRRAGEALPPVPASPAVAMDFASLLDLLDGAPASLANDHHPTLDDMDTSDASDACFDRRMSVDGVDDDETSPPSPRRTVDDAIRETVRDALALDLPRDRDRDHDHDHHRSSLSLSTRAGVPATAPGQGFRRRDSSRSSFESDATRASTATNDCARASSAPPRKSTTRPGTPSRDGARLVASLEPQHDLDLDARCLLARAEDEEDAADGRRLRESGGCAKIGFAPAAATFKSRLPRGSTLNASAPAFAPATVHSVPRASCGREIQPPRFCALVPVPRERCEMWTGIGGVLPAAAEVLRVLDGMRRKQDVEGVPAFA
jgi:hypothetical protein